MAEIKDLERLLIQHQRLIGESAISDEVRDTRGYISIRTRAELKRKGFAESQTSVPTLLIPVFNVHGELAMYQSRPDEPRIVKSKAMKYEMPKGSRMVLDVHPSIREQLADPKIPLFVTEGIRKADSAISQGICCIALLGVWNWRGTNGLGGRTALADWEIIALNGREVYIVFDSDVMLKPEIHAALSRLKAFLEKRQPGWRNSKKR